MSRAELTDLVIDTNILLLLLGYQCLEFLHLRGSRRGEVLSALRGRSDNLPPDRFEYLWRVFLRARRRIVTQHVVAEAYGLRRRLPFPKELVWRSALTILLKPGLEEDSCSIGELSQNAEYMRILTEHGPTDTGLLHSAERHKAILVTEDDALGGAAHARNVRVVSLRRIEELAV